MSLDRWLPPLASGGGLAALGFGWKALGRWRHRARFGRVEDEQLVANLVERAVQTQAGVLEDLRQERIDDRQRITSLDATVEGLRRRVRILEDRVVSLARNEGELQAELVRTKRERDAAVG